MTQNPDPLAMCGLHELPPDGPIWEWAENNIIIPARTPTNFPGAYRSDIAVYTRDILDLIQDQAINTIVIEAGAQTGKTMLAYVALAYWCAVDPGPCMLVYPTEDIARSQSETRVMPIFEDSPTLAALIPHDRKSCWTKLQYRLKKNVVNWVGSNSPANLASRAVKYLITDEEDKYPVRSGDEADPVSLAAQRTKTFGNRRKHLRTSTPTTSNGHIHRAFLAGDQRRLFLPCPHCGFKQPLVWAQVRFNSDLPIDEAARGAFYECVQCKGHIMDGHKAGMMAGREWLAGSVSVDSSMVSLHISSLYAPWVSWAQLVRKFLHAKSNPEQLQDFVNSELGEPFDKADTRIYSDQIQAREGGYEEGVLWVKKEPYAAQFETAVDGQDYTTLIWSDVQKGYLVAVCRCFAKNGDSGLVWAGELNGFDALEELSKKYNAQVTAIDRRYRGDEVLAWVYDHRHDGYIVTAGVARRGGTLFDGHPLNIDEGKRGGRSGVVRQVYELVIDPNQAKDILEKCVSGDATAPRWMVPAGYGMNRVYCDQMQAEQRVAGKWEQIGQRENHRLDAEACLVAIACKMGFWEWRNKKPDTEKDGGNG